MWKLGVIDFWQKHFIPKFKGKYKHKINAIERSAEPVEVKSFAVKTKEVDSKWKVSMKNR